jgi:hypothetical protein
MGPFWHWDITHDQWTQTWTRHLELITSILDFGRITHMVLVWLCLRRETDQVVSVGEECLVRASWLCSRFSAGRWQASAVLPAAPVDCRRPSFHAFRIARYLRRNLFSTGFRCITEGSGALNRTIPGDAGSALRTNAT